MSILRKQNFFSLKSSVENCPKNQRSIKICPSCDRFSKPADFPKPQRPFLRPLEAADLLGNVPNHPLAGK